MSMVDFSRGELAPTMRYRSDLEVYHKGVETLERFLPTPRGGLVRGPGNQVLELLPPSDRPPAVRIFSLGSTGMANDIPAVGTGDTMLIGTATYDTEFRTNPILKNQEIEILLSFTEYGEADDIVAYWVNTPNRIPAFYQRIWNYSSGAYSYPAIDFDDTREVRIAQIENNVYIIGRTQIYRIFWDKEKITPVWNTEKAYNERDVVTRISGDAIYSFECLEGNTGQDPSLATGMDYWRVVYPSYISFEIISPRVGYEFLKGIGEESDPYKWLANAVWKSATKYYKGDVIGVALSLGEDPTLFECIGEHTTADVTDKFPNSAGEAWTAFWEDYSEVEHPITDDAEGVSKISDDDRIYHRSSFAFREETVPREMVVHHNRLIFAGSSIRPSTIHGSEVYHYMNFGAGINDDEPWIVTLSGDRVGRILWMTVTDQLYIGTSGGIFAVSGVLTPNQFQLRKVTSHAASTVHAVAAAGSVIFFHQDGKTLREVEYADQAENYRAFDLTIFSNHLFEQFKAIKMVVVNDPSIIIWILRADGTLVSLSYEKTVSMYAFARHEFQGMVFDIVAGKNNELYAIIELSDTKVRQLVRIGDNDISYGTEVLEDIKLDGLLSLVNIDNSNLFATQILNKSMRDWYEAHGISSVSDMFDWKSIVDASEASLTGLLSKCGLNHLDEIPSLDLSGNTLTGEVPANLVNLMRNAVAITDPIDIPIALDLEGNPVTSWEIPTVPVTWDMIILKDTSLPIGQLRFVIDSVIASEALESRAGTLDLRGLGVLSMDDALSEAVSLKTSGWTVLLDNETDWDDQYITFNGNGNTAGAAPISQLCLYRETVTIPGHGTLSRANYDFNGWAQGESSPATHNSGDRYTKDIQGLKTFYATWLAANQLSYNGNSNTGGLIPVDPNTYNPNQMITLLPGAPTRSGYTFSGWALNIAGTGTVYQAGQQIEMGSAGITVFAKWTINQYTLTFSLNGAQKGNAPAAVTGNYETTHTIPGTPTKVHRSVSDQWQKFRRWNTKSDGTGSVYNVGNTYTFPSGNVTLFAEFIDYSVGDDGPNGGVITQDLGYYALRLFSSYNQPDGGAVPAMPGLGSGKMYYVWRYVEMMKINTFPAGAWRDRWYEKALYNEVYWFYPELTYLVSAFTSGVLPNVGTDRYWTGHRRRDAYLVVFFGDWEYTYMEPSGASDWRASPDWAYNHRLGRGI